MEHERISVQDAANHFGVKTTAGAGSRRTHRRLGIPGETGSTSTAICSTSGAG
jgi:hypothetical protein